MDQHTQRGLYQLVRPEKDLHDEEQDDAGTLPSSPRIWSTSTTESWVRHLPMVATACLFLVTGFLLGKFAANGTLGQSSSTAVDIFDNLRNLPPVDLVKEYGLKPSDLTLYTKPLGKDICLVNVDNRVWSPSLGLDKQDDLGWGRLNQYLYAQLHGYEYKYIKVPEQQGLHPTWVKVKEQFRLTMEGKCKFVIVLDADIIFHDLRIPLEALMSYWNITNDIALAGARGWAKDLKGRHLLNTGFLISQKTLEFPNLMQDWINCPTDVKYPNCSHWRYEWAHEQSALSEHVRYDYMNVIREMKALDVHSERGKTIKHYWGPAKVDLPMAAKKAIWNRFMPQVSESLVKEWKNHFVHITSDDQYDFLMHE